MKNKLFLLALRSVLYFTAMGKKYQQHYSTTQPTLPLPLPQLWLQIQMRQQDL